MVDLGMAGSCEITSTRRTHSDGQPNGQADAYSRLLVAVAQLCADYGYSTLTVDRLLPVAEVSRATFYQHFESVEDCFITSYRVHSRGWEETFTPAPTVREPRVLTALEPLLDLTTRRPRLAVFLLREGLAAGPAGRAERDELVARLRRSVETLPPPSTVADMPLRIFLGGILRFLAISLSSGTVDSRLAEDIGRWLDALARPATPRHGERRFSDLPEVLDEGHAPEIPSSRSLPTRERLIRATASAIYARGYRETTVSDIVARAGTSRRLFYRHFADRRDAFTSCYEHAFAGAVSASTAGYFRSNSWPQRVWDAASAFTSFFAAEPAFAYLGFVECYALGPTYLPRVHDTQFAFTLFLEEGYRQRESAADLPRSCSALIAAAIFEAGFLAARAGAALHMRRLQPLVVYIALAPFIGPESAESFIASKLDNPSSQ